MLEPFEEIAKTDRLLHDPIRLAIMTVLDRCGKAEIALLERLTRVSNGNIHLHLARLEEAGLVRVQKEHIYARPRTTVTLTTSGQAAYTAYWERLQELRQSAQEYDIAGVQEDVRGKMPKTKRRTTSTPQTA